MIFLNSRIIAKSNGQYNGRADHNIAELKSIMKGLTIRERKASSQDNFEPSKSVASFASDTPSAWANTSSSTQTNKGARVWAGLTQKKQKQVKTFAL